MNRQWLGMDSTWHNINGKIWEFVLDEFQVEIVMDADQVLTLQLIVDRLQEYASNDRDTRVELWDALYYLSTQIQTP